TGTGKLKAIFDNQDASLWPNQFVNIRLLLEVHKNATLIPSVAVQNGPQGNYVFVVKPDKTAEVRQVAIALTQNNVASIASGVNPGDTVVVDGQDKLKAGTTVAPHPAGAQGNRPTQSAPTGSP